MEQDIIRFIRDPTQHQLEFQDLPTSYLRLAAHRVAQYYFLQSVAMPDSVMPDGCGSQIVIHKTSYCRIPPVRLADIPVSFQLEDANNSLKIAIKQRPCNSSQIGGGLNTSSSNSNSMKTVEERKEEYNRARARIFSSICDTGNSTKSDFETAFPDLPKFHSVPSSSDDSLFIERSETNLKRTTSNSSIGSSRLSRNRQEKEPVIPRQQKSTNRVAIFRDRELDRKDPDYDRNYDRYMQRFDPGFGFNGGPYTIQPLYAPAVNYNSEFPQLGTGHRPQISIENQPRPTPQQLRGPWPISSTSSAINYGPPEGLMPPFNPNYVGAHPTSPIYLHSSQFPVTPRPIQFLHGHEQIQYPQLKLAPVLRLVQSQTQRGATFRPSRFTRSTMFFPTALSLLFFFLWSRDNYSCVQQFDADLLKRVVGSSVSCCLQSLSCSSSSFKVRVSADLFRKGEALFCRNFKYDTRHSDLERLFTRYGLI
ncbi:hypothetical protein KSP40_PGU014004 [Platanthera guangdongensis]|uniref:SUZ domain-containing protein n=1 Tax=Platanthera guangdongensis TaxID=2320717 RepID=A0ABR2MIS8_9ASPA